MEETKAMFPRLKKQIQEALSKLEQQLVSLRLTSLIPCTIWLTTLSQEQDKGPGDQSNPEDITKAKEAIADAMTAIRESS